MVVAVLISAEGREAYAQPQCSVPSTASASFGSATSFEVQSTPQYASIPVVGTCGGSLLTALVLLGDPPYFRATIGNSANGFHLKNAAGDMVPYSIFADPGHTVPIQPGATFNYYTPALLDLLGLLGGSVGNLPMHFKASATSPISAGTYTDTFTIQWSWKICNLGVLFCLGYAESAGPVPTTVNLTLIVTNACQVTSAPDIVFGSAPTLGAFPAVTQHISVLCTKGAVTHSVGLSGGQNPSGGRRWMSGSAGMLAYDIFQLPSNTIWGTAPGTRATAPGPADGVTPQLFPYAARIYLDQPVPSVGTYSDTVIIVVMF
jgi:spore coat protein U-like protein